MLIFMHLPKTGGTSIEAVIGRDDHYPLRVPGGCARDEIDWLSHQPKRRLHLATSIYGHMRYGVDSLIGDRRAEYATVLRDPVERIVSLYRWLSDSPRTSTSHLIAGGFEAFCDRPIADLDNGLTRLLASRHEVAGMAPGRSVTESDFVIASSRLNEFAVLGVTEHLDRFATALADRFGWMPPDLPHRRASHSERPAVDPWVEDVLRHRNRWDQRLYEMALEQAS